MLPYLRDLDEMNNRQAQIFLRALGTRKGPSSGVISTSERSLRRRVLDSSSSELVCVQRLGVCTFSAVTSPAQVPISRAAGASGDIGGRAHVRARTGATRHFCGVRDVPWHHRTSSASCRLDQSSLWWYNLRRQQCSGLGPVAAFHTQGRSLCSKAKESEGSEDDPSHEKVHESAPSSGVHEHESHIPAQPQHAIVHMPQITEVSLNNLSFLRPSEEVSGYF